MTFSNYYDKVIKQGIKDAKGGIEMATNLSYKKPNSANNRSHSCRSTKKQQQVNLQVVRLEDGTRVRISTREKRTLMKNDQIAA